MAGCPEKALSAFRKSLIGRGKPLTARWADAAIGGAQAVRRTGPLTGRPARREEVNEPMAQNLTRLRWYLKRRMPVIFARPAGYAYTRAEGDVITAAQEAGVTLTFLEWADDAVERMPAEDYLGGTESVRAVA